MFVSQVVVCLGATVFSQVSSLIDLCCFVIRNTKLEGVVVVLVFRLKLTQRLFVIR